jgi:hypothetical protein
MVEVEIVDRGEQLPAGDMASRLRSARTYHDAIEQLNQLQTGVRKRPTAGTVLTPREKALSWVKYLQLDVCLPQLGLVEYLTHRYPRSRSCP